MCPVRESSMRKATKIHVFSHSFRAKQAELLKLHFVHYLCTCCGISSNTKQCAVLHLLGTLPFSKVEGVLVVIILSIAICNGGYSPSCHHSNIHQFIQ